MPGYVYISIHTYTHMCSHICTYVHICLRLLTYACLCTYVIYCSHTDSQTVGAESVAFSSRTNRDRRHRGAGRPSAARRLAAHQCSRWQCCGCCRTPTALCRRRAAMTADEFGGGICCRQTSGCGRDSSRRTVTAQTKSCSRRCGTRMTGGVAAPRQTSWCAGSFG